MLNAVKRLNQSRTRDSNSSRPFENTISRFRDSPSLIVRIIVFKIAVRPDNFVTLPENCRFAILKFLFQIPEQPTMSRLQEQSHSDQDSEDERNSDSDGNFQVTL